MPVLSFALFAGDPAAVDGIAGKGCSVSVRTRYFRTALWRAGPRRESNGALLSLRDSARSSRF